MFSRQAIGIRNYTKFQAMIFGTVLLLSSQTGCQQDSDGPTRTPPLNSEQAVALVSRWINGQSPRASVDFVSLTSETDFVTVQMKITDFEYREPLKLRPVVYTGNAEARFQWRNRKWAVIKFIIGPGTASSHAWDGLYITDAYTAMEQTNSRQNDVNTNENAAIGNVRRLVTAELAYMSRNQNTCGTMQDLIREGLIEQSYASGNVFGYRLSIRDVGNTCGVLAVPRSFRVTGVRSFYAPVTDGFIRYTTDGSFPTDNHPRLQ